MTPPTDDAPTNHPFLNLMAHQSGSNIQDFLNQIHDAIFKFKNINEADQTELKTLLSTISGDHLFNEFVLKFFVNDMTAHGLKSSIQNISEFPNISLLSALRLLNDVYTRTENEMIKAYLVYLTFDVESFLDFAQERWNKVKLSNNLFNNFIEQDALPKYIKHNASIHVSNKHGYCLLSFFCQKDEENKAVIPALIKYANVNIEWEKATSLQSLFAQLVNNYESLNAVHPIQGFDVNGSFENAVKLFTIVAPNWDNLSATFTLRNKPLPTVYSSSLMGGSRIQDSDMVKIFAGEYNLVPSSEPTANQTNLDVIADFNVYNQLSQQRKLQVSHFLLANRKRFNDVLGEAAQLIINGLQTKLNSSNVSAAFSSRQFAPTYARSVGFSNEDSQFNSEVRSFIDKLSKSYSSANPKTFDQAISFIVHQYIPLLRQFQNRAYETYGLANARANLSKFATDKTLNVVGVASIVPSISGGAKRITPKQEESSIPQTSEPQTDMSPSIDEPKTDDLLVQGGSSSSDLVDSYIQGQKEFNKSYEEIYRRLISALNAVSITNVQAQTFSKLYSVVSQFDSIAIKSAKTTSFLSGYYGAKNYNRLYTKAVENTIRAIEDAHVDSFNGCLTVLNSLKELMNRTAQKVQELRNKFINSPKSVSEMLIVAAKKIKTPCKLTQKDFNNLNEAINRIYNTIQNYTSETSAYNTKQQLESYINKIEDREKVIKEHYEVLKSALRSKISLYASQPNRERQYAKEAQEEIYNQLCQCMLWMNKVFDTKLAKERIAHLHDANLSPEQIDRIEKALTSFKNGRLDDEFQRLMRKLSERIENVTIGSVFKLTKKLRKLIEKSGYIDFIAQLYKELGIFSSDFNWQEFEDNYTTIVCLSSIRIDPMYKIGEERVSYYGIAHKLALAFEKQCSTDQHKFIDCGNSDVKNVGYTFILDFLRRKLDRTTKSNLSVSSVSGLFGNPKDFDDLLSTNNADTEQQFFEKCCDTFEMTKHNFSEKNCFKLDVFEDGNQVKTSPQSKVVPETLKDKCSKLFTTGALTPQVKEAILCINEVMSTYVDKVDKPKPFFFSRLPAMFAELLFGLKNQSSDFGKLCKSTLSKTDQWGVSLVDGTHEIQIAQYSVDALFANVLAIIDKYWAVKYTGNLNIPLNINTVLRGGSVSEADETKVEGGSVFDSMPLHDQSYSSVVPEAVPYYICALHICQYYIQTFSVKKIDESNMELVLTINKISGLYPVYEIFHKYQASIETLTPQQLKICLAVFNEYWNQTTGSEANRLSRAIDLLFNELNACFIFTDRLQYDIMKSTNSLSKTSVDVLSDKLSYLIEKMKNRLNESVVEQREDPALMNKRLEGLLKHAFNEVKTAPESQRLATLKSMLCNSDKGGELRDFYAFMELVISPLLTCAKSYMYIFSLYDNYTFKDNKSYREGQRSNANYIDLNNINIFWRDFNSKKDGFIERLDSAWNIIQAIKNNTRSELKVLFMESPIVLKWNRALLCNALDSLHKTGKFNMPNFWIVMDEHSYPTYPTIDIKYSESFAKSDTIPLLRQLYPTVEARTVADYYNHTMTEFAADYDHFIHAFLSYPGLSDKSIKLISSKAHDAFRFANVPAGKELYKSNDDSFSKTNVYTFKPINNMDEQSSILDSARPLAEIPVYKVDHYIYPPSLSLHTIIPRYVGIQPIEELEIVSENKFGKQINTQIDGTSLFIKSKSANNDNIYKCEYTWLDWVVYQVARCDKLNFTIPYRFLQMLQNSPALNAYLRPPGFTKTGYYQQYNRSSNGVYANIITQNVIARSSSQDNKDKAEFAGMNPTWIASLVAVVPYLINTLTANKLSMEANVQYNGQSVNQQITQLIDVLTAFYDEISNYTPFIGFMADTVNLSQTKVKPHLFAELLSLVSNGNINDLDASDYIKIEWANQYFFNYVDNIQFPEYKNRDRFEWIKQFAPEKVANGTFKAEFDTTVQTLGRLTWAGLIAKTHELEVQFKNVYRELDEVIIKVIHIMAECDTGIIEEYVRNVVTEYNDYYNRGIDYTDNLNLSGGAVQFKALENKNNVEIVELVKRLTVGLFDTQSLSVDAKGDFTAAENKLVEEYNFTTAAEEAVKPLDETKPTVTITPSTTPAPTQTTPAPTTATKPTLSALDMGEHTEATARRDNKADGTGSPSTAANPPSPSPQQPEQQKKEQLKFNYNQNNTINAKNIDQKFYPFVIARTEIPTNNGGYITNVCNKPSDKLASFNECFNLCSDTKELFAKDFSNSSPTLNMPTNIVGIMEFLKAGWHFGSNYPAYIEGSNGKGDKAIEVSKTLLTPLKQLGNNIKSGVEYMKRVFASSKMNSFKFDKNTPESFIQVVVLNNLNSNRKFEFRINEADVKVGNNPNPEAKITIDFSAVIDKYPDYKTAITYYGSLATSILCNIIHCFDNFMADLKNKENKKYFNGQPFENNHTAIVIIGLYHQLMYNYIRCLSNFASNVNKATNDKDYPLTFLKECVKIITNPVIVNCYSSDTDDPAALPLWHASFLLWKDYNEDVQYYKYFSLTNNKADPKTITEHFTVKNQQINYTKDMFLLYADIVGVYLGAFVSFGYYRNDVFGNAAVAHAQSIIGAKLDKFNTCKTTNDSNPLQAEMKKYLELIQANLKNNSPNATTDDAPNSVVLKAINNYFEDRGFNPSRNVVLYGGASNGFSENKKEVIYGTAAAIARNLANHAVYYDFSQNFNNVPLLVNFTNLPTKKENNAEVIDYDKLNAAIDFDAYNYKFFYNPNLCALFNKTRSTHREFINYMLAAKKLFIYDSFTPVRNTSVNWNKISLKISEPFDKLFKLNGSDVKSLISSANDYTLNKETYQNIIHHYISLASGEDQERPPNNYPRLDNTMFNQSDEIGIKAVINRANKFKYDKVEGNAYEQPLEEAYPLNANQVMYLPLLNAISIRKPITKNIHINDLMFLLIPTNKLVKQYLFSPQKDIYNATIYTVDDIQVPTILNFAKLEYASGFSHDVLSLHNFMDTQFSMLDCQTDNKFISDPTTERFNIDFFNAFKNISNFQSFSFNPIYKFIQLLLQDNINQVFNIDNQIKYNNFGFDTGNLSKLANLSGGLIGGYDISNDFNDGFVNLQGAISGNKEIEILQNAYNLDGKDSTNNSSCKSKILYSYLFKGGFDSSQLSSSQVMFRLILNYFHKYNISFNSMFNQLCFPSILFNAAALRLSIKRIKDLVTSMIGNYKSYNDKTTDTDGYKARLFEFIRYYLNAYVDHKQRLALDLCKDYRYQIVVDGNRKNYVEIRQIPGEVDKATDLIRADNKAIALGNQYIMPSVANNFMIELTKYTSLDNPIEHCEGDMLLFGSGVMESLRHLDSVVAYISVIFMLLKHTSYYSHEYDRDMSYFNVESPEMFSVI